jgi:hypothetical protein
MSRKAEKLYEEFHKFSPTRIDEMHRSFYIPEVSTCVGPALHVLYRSDKLDPLTYAKPTNGTDDYIHEHKKGVKVYMPGSGDGPERKVPQRVCGVSKLTFLGKCLGFGYTDEEGDEVEATCTGKVELCTTPDGRALLVIEGRRKVLALIWGGGLKVKPQGIVG